jgi:hypothetical protein
MIVAATVPADETSLAAPAVRASGPQPTSTDRCRFGPASFVA